MRVSTSHFSFSFMYTCYCFQKCGGIRHKVSKRVYQPHSTFRQPESQIEQETAAPEPMINSVSFITNVYLSFNWSNITRCSQPQCRTHLQKLRGPSSRNPLISLQFRTQRILPRLLREPRPLSCISLLQMIPLS